MGATVIAGLTLLLPLGNLDSFLRADTTGRQRWLFVNS
jgi:hypothetical protein